MRTASLLGSRVDVTTVSRVVNINRWLIGFAPYLHLLVPGSVELVWLVDGSLLPPRDHEMEGEGFEKRVTHST